MWKYQGEEERLENTRRKLTYNRASTKDTGQRIWPRLDFLEENLYYRHYLKYKLNARVILTFGSWPLNLANNIQQFKMIRKSNGFIRKGRFLGP